MGSKETQRELAAAVKAAQRLKLRNAAEDEKERDRKAARAQELRDALKSVEAVKARLMDEFTAETEWALDNPEAGARKPVQAADPQEWAA